MMNKKAVMVTMFIMIGIVILTMMVFVGWYVVQAKDVMLELRTEELKVLREYTTSCLDDVFNQALYYSARQGGIIWPDKSIETPYGVTSLDVPNPEITKQQIAKDIKSYLPTCIEEYDFMEIEDIDLIRGSIDVEVDLGEKDTSVLLTMPVKIKDDVSSVQTEKFTTKADVRLKKLIEYAQNVYQYDDVWLSYLGEIDVDTTAIEYENTIIYIFEDKKSNAADVNYLFMFGKEIN